jgi:phosphatidylglycerol:prolipoprotein diacylglycerol transferase
MHPILFHLGGSSYHAYNLLVGLGYLLGAAYLTTQLPGRWLSWRTRWGLAGVLFLGAILGGKIFYLIVEWRNFAAYPSAALKYWKAGWVFWGGFLTAILFGRFYQLAYNRLYPEDRKPYLPIADYLSVALPLGHWLGRVGCFMEGCCYGRPTDLPWGVRFMNPGSGMEKSLLGVPLHPVQLYESAGILAICLFNLLYVLPRTRAGRIRPGTAFLGYLSEYAVLRFFMEFFRGDDRGAFLWPILSPGQWMSLAVLLVCVPWLWRRGVRLGPED